MRSFAVIALAAAGANAAAYGYPAESSSTPAEYYPEASSTPAEYYPAASSTPAYPAYPAESSKAEYPSYPAESSKVEYPVVYSSAPAYTTTKVYTGLTTVCPEPTTVTYGSKTYTVKSSTTLIDDDCEYTTTEVVKPTPYPVYTPAHSEYAPPKYSSAAPPAPYPSKPAGNGTVPVYPTGVKPSASASKPATPEFTGAAGKASAGLLAVAGAAAAFFL